jgi:hypothetical protein
MRHDAPLDLVPLPTQPWAVRPSTIPLDREEVRTALWLAEGNISEAALILKVTSLRLRSFIRGSEYLSRELEEFKERKVDEAEQAIFEGLRDPEERIGCAKFILNSSTGKQRGWGTGNGNGAVNINTNGGAVSISWADGTTLDVNEDPPMKDVTPIQDAAVGINRE